MLLENICAGHTPNTSIFGHLKVKADQLTQGEGYDRQLTCLKVKAIYHIRKNMCF